MIPRWISDKRVKTCIKCEKQIGCSAKYTILSEAPQCPLGALPSAADEITAKAWPSGATPVSGCCDSAQNYLSRYPTV